jgi:molecular chaperone HtpG
MKEDQEEIYYIMGPSHAKAGKSPYLEAFKEKGYNVLIMTDEIDDIIMGGLGEYKGKKLKSVVKGDISLDKSGEADKKKTREKYSKLVDLIKDRLKDEVKDVRLSGRLKDSAVVLVADEGGIDPNMERLLKAMGQEVPDQKRILEINPSHPVFDAMNALFEKDKNDPLLPEYITLLYDQALLLEGSKPKDPVVFAKSMARLMVENAKRS